MRNLSDVILKPVITEKAMDMISEKRYVFKVAKDANKPEIAAAVEAMFDGVKVADVNTINIIKDFAILTHSIWRVLVKYILFCLILPTTVLLKISCFKLFMFSPVSALT